MSAQTTTVDRKDSAGKETGLLVLGGETIFKGSLVTVDAASGYAQANDGSTITLGAGDIFAGVATDTADNSAGSSGDERIQTQHTGVFEFTYAAGGLTQANLFDEVVQNDTTGDGAVTVSGGGVQVKVGRIVEIVSATVCRVRIDGYAGKEIAA